MDVLTVNFNFSLFFKYLEALRVFYAIITRPITSYHRYIRKIGDKDLDKCDWSEVTQFFKSLSDGDSGFNGHVPSKITSTIVTFHLHADYVLQSLELSYLEEILPSNALNLWTYYTVLMGFPLFQTIANGFLDVWCDDHLQTMLQQTFSITQFRPNQLRAIRDTLNSKDVITVFPTGYGKSLVYMLPCVVQHGITVVFSPLCSLISDQVRRLNALGISAVWLEAGLAEGLEAQILAKLAYRYPSYKVLMMTPEKLLHSKRIKTALDCIYKRGLLSRIVLDECHTISLWGHGFRPAYLKLCSELQIFEGTPKLCLTATAGGAILKDISGLLALRQPSVVKEISNRHNLQYLLRDKLHSFINDVFSLIETHFSNETGIIFCRTKKETEQLASALQQKGLKADFFHAQMSSPEKVRVLSSWMSGECKIVVATIAFGLGTLC